MQLSIEEKVKKREDIYAEFMKNRRIGEEISARNKQLEMLNLQIKVLQEKASELGFELDILQSIKDSQKTILVIENNIDKYINNLKEKNLLNNWIETFSSNNNGHCTIISSIRNATYTGTIILNKNESKNFYRVDFDLSLSSLLLDSVKDQKHKFQTIFEVKIMHEGKILFTEDSANEYIDKLKEKYNCFFEDERAALIEEFKDLNNNKFSAYDFIKYDDMIIDGFNVMDFEFNKEEQEIPF